MRSRRVILTPTFVMYYSSVYGDLWTDSVGHYISSSHSLEHHLPIYQFQFGPNPSQDSTFLAAARTAVIMCNRAHEIPL
ncbi:hypothetical protein N657DRAFT_649568 [Parathielavia appendiculata]|uniref:Uncharacterized protein n=1 Tax=Parathielavia appendiculata TaxID=2587402 RepID=A0AAN6Z0Z4_9PEZI|nr:hypothetical protein N657DRAFT_649568 [Parathielavia appendiculata]